ncbi:cytochrome c oxidase assembly protein [Asanoa sp. WMMD1127]|uniref:cytochrome c oxidase assembly protein n=1 Tax=Asanoa sp. WMMD1127 TaxID=3016107 RepID=UPI002415B112|nr:cytochrome c oxidase assembly protein [Asanoa sp. WMMD1127]MDG4825088.1 cytochrome c oxidase assembly protein [Asanoa sp. WMMD1127]
MNGRLQARTTLLGAGLGVAAAGLAVLAVTVGQPYAPLGVADPGLLVRLATPVVRLVTDVAATIVVGALVFATFLTRAQSTGIVSPAGYAALRTATRAAAIWLPGATLMVALDAADKAGVPITRLTEPDALPILIDALEAPKAWAVSAACAAVVALGCRWSLRRTTGAVLLVVATVGLVAPLTTGHSASEADHDVATVAVIVHVVAAATWLGTLWSLLRARGGLAQQAWDRYRRLSSACAVVVAVSGLVDGTVLAPGATPVTTGYGWLLLAKGAVLVVLGSVLFRLRTGVHTTRRRLVAGELLLVLAAYGLSVALTRIPAPKFLLGPATGHETLIGYDLTGPPTLVRLAVDWRIEILFLPLAVLAAVAYALGVRRLRRDGRRWPTWRTVAWWCGCAVIVAATSSGLGRYAPAMFSVHAVSHMAMGMLAPLLLVLGTPFTLARAALPVAPPDSLPGPREWLEAVRASAPARWLTHPVVGTLVFSAAPFALYFTGLFDVSIRYHWAHVAVHALFLVVGFAFCWMVVGGDPLPRPANDLFRLGALMVAMPLCIVFGAALVNHRAVLGDGNASGNLYTALALPWVPDLQAEQRLGGYVSLALGEACMLVLLIVLVIRWSRRIGAREDPP